MYPSPRWRSWRSGVGLSRLICSVSRSLGSERSVSSRRPASSMPLVSTVVGAAVAAGAEDPADFREQEGLSARHEDFGDAGPGRFTGDLLDTLEAERPPRGFGGGAHTAIVATQIAVEIRVEPQARADRSADVGIRRRLSVPKHPAGPIPLGGGFDQGVMREAAPGLQLRADTGFAAGDGQKIARPAVAQRRDQLQQQAGGKPPGTSVKLDARLRRHTQHYNGEEAKSIGGHEPAMQSSLARWASYPVTRIFDYPEGRPRL